MLWREDNVPQIRLSASPIAPPAFRAPTLQLEALQWLHAHGCPFDSQVTHGLVSAYNLEGLRWAIDAGAPVVDYICCWAACKGRRDVIELLRAHGCPWYDACWEAAQEGHWGLVRWMRAQDPPAPWDAAKMEWLATVHGQVDVADAARAEIGAHTVIGGGGVAG
jgi:hypothetical protein